MMDMIYDTLKLAEIAAIDESEDMNTNGRTIDFDGNNCDDLDDNVCDGWDGRSRRCECGNRRVSWSYNQYTDNKWGFYAEAY
jgi:hypothetical protein